MALYVKEKAKSRANNREEKRKRERSESRAKHQSREQKEKDREQRKWARQKAPRHRGLNVSTAASAAAGGTFEFLSGVKANACVLCTCIQVSTSGGPGCDTKYSKVSRTG